MEKVLPAGENHVSSQLYHRLPDGSEFDHNRVYDVIDRFLSNNAKRNGLKKRLLHQYDDAQRNVEIIQDRYDYINEHLFYDEQRFMKSPTCRLDTIYENEKERPGVQRLLSQAWEELYIARNRVAGIIHALKTDDQKIVFTAHYICGADLRWISAVYHHWDYWASGILDKALESINEFPDQVEKPAEYALEKLIDEWHRDETEYKESLAIKQDHPPLDDCSMMLGLA